DQLNFEDSDVEISAGALLDRCLVTIWLTNSGISYCFGNLIICYCGMQSIKNVRHPSGTADEDMILNIMRPAASRSLQPHPAFSSGQDRQLQPPTACDPSSLVHSSDN